LRLLDHGVGQIFEAKRVDEWSDVIVHFVWSAGDRLEVD
jgi:hypothetical protein